jgi:tRNA threonylcarbamoyladenosine biosynthesis protein TsaB
LAEGGWVGCGSGFDVYGPILRERFGDRLIKVLPDRFPHAREVAHLARHVVESGRATAPELATPVYVRDKVALKTAER